MWRVALLAVVLGLVSSGCASSEPAVTTTDAPIDTVATITPQTATSVPATTTTMEPTTTTTLATLPPTTTTLPPTEPDPVCPDLFGEEPDAAASDVVLAGWREPAGELLWELPLGNRLPSWGVNNDEIVLGFPDGELMGLVANTCELAWSVTLEPIVDLVVLPNKGTVVSTATELAGYGGPGFASWRMQTERPLRFLVEAGDVGVFTDGRGTLTALHFGGGDEFFTWDSGSDTTPLVAIDTLHVYRGLDGTIEARPAMGGGVEWSRDIDGLVDLFSVTGTLLAQTNDMLHAIEPASGDIRWSVPFTGRVTPPVVLEHSELHLAVWPTTLWHLDQAEGSVEYEGTAPAGTEWLPAMDDSLVLQIGDDGMVTAINLLQQALWTIETGANRLDRVTSVERAFGAIAVSLTFSGERF